MAGGVGRGGRWKSSQRSFAVFVRLPFRPTRWAGGTVLRDFATKWRSLSIPLRFPLAAQGHCGIGGRISCCKKWAMKSGMRVLFEDPAAALGQPRRPLSQAEQKSRRNNLVASGRAVSCHPSLAAHGPGVAASARAAMVQCLVESGPRSSHRVVGAGHQVPAARRPCAIEVAVGSLAQTDVPRGTGRRLLGVEEGGGSSIAAWAVWTMHRSTDVRIWSTIASSTSPTPERYSWSFGFQGAGQVDSWGASKSASAILSSKATASPRVSFVWHAGSSRQPEAQVPVPR